MKKLLVVCGLTAVGKTSLALKLAKKFDGELISADSRQVYKGMDIGTGKDIPENFEFRNSKLRIKDFEIGCYTNGKIRIWGYDLVSPKEDFNVSDYIHIAREVIFDIWNRNNLPIVVGGTGLYIKGVVDGISTTGIGKDDKLRKVLQKKSVKELITILSKLDSKKIGSLNDSDRKNPARLVRAIEVAKSKNLNNENASNSKLKSDSLLVGLKLSREILSDLIAHRVRKRVDEGILEEIDELLSKGVSWNDKSMMALGYRQLRDFFEGSKSIQQAIGDWIIAERQYAKRQMTWFVKDKRIHWFDVSGVDYPKPIAKFVARWYFNSKDVSKKN